LRVGGWNPSGDAMRHTSNKDRNRRKVLIEWRRPRKAYWASVKRQHFAKQEMRS
jgi:hypothetical protein